MIGMSTEPQVSAPQCTTPEAKSAVKIPATEARERKTDSSYYINSILLNKTVCSCVKVKLNLKEGCIILKSNTAAKRLNQNWTLNNKKNPHLSLLKNKIISTITFSVRLNLIEKLQGKKKHA